LLFPFHLWPRKLGDRNWPEFKDEIARNPLETVCESFVLGYHRGPL
jgi:hypothetical protein